MPIKWTYLCLIAVATGATAQAGEGDSQKLYAAIRAGNPAVLKVLLEHGISPNTADDRAITPLMYAAEVGSAAEMRILIAGGADVNAQNALGSTALMWSVGDSQKVRLLLSFP